jgi:hypothetical protein
MKKIQELIERFKELSKNTNMSYGAAPNMSGSGNGDMAAKAEANPKPKKPSGGTPPANPMPTRPAEMLKFSKCGQWSLHKAKCPKCGMDPCDCK